MFFFLKYIFSSLFIFVSPSHSLTLSLSYSVSGSPSLSLYHSSCLFLSDYPTCTTSSLLEIFIKIGLSSSTRIFKAEKYDSWIST